MSEKKEEKFGRYTLKNGKLYYKNSDPEEGEKDAPKEEVISRHVKIKEITQDLHSKEVELVLEYVYKGQMMELLISRRQLELTEFKKLVSKGVDASFHNAARVNRFLNFQESSAPFYNKHSKMGWWVKEDQLIYQHHQLHGSKSLQSIYSGPFNIEPTGSLEGWKSIIKKEVIGHAPLELALMLGFSAPVVGYLQKFIDTDSLLFHLSGESSTGKTTAARLAVSAFGKPSDKKNGLIRSFNSTANALYRQLINNTGVPFVLDEASSDTRRNFTDFIYKLAAGNDKMRLTKEAELREIDSWETSFIFTAEHSLLEKSNQNTGLMMRLFEFKDIEWTKNAKNADRLKVGLNEHYGHAGVTFVQHMLTLDENDVIDRWQKLKQLCLEKMQETDAFSSRVSDKFAVVMLAGEIAEKALGLKFDHDGVLDMLIAQDQEMANQRDITERALKYIVNQLYVNKKKFKTALFEFEERECWGAIEYKNGNTEVYIVSSILQNLLKDGDFSDPNLIVKKWKEKGVVKGAKDKNVIKKSIPEVDDQYKQKDNRAQFYCLVLDNKVFEENPKPSPPIRENNRRKPSKRVTITQTDQELRGSIDWGEKGETL
ncbi:hypothetical protein KP77_28560 [Jeotgalibacillus alimentarius]|uniref:DUF927 domain-containing protein n=1 Tax=Jeotgalibacillus alimentarius TaxID=135826 RepID=A0A0C2RV17_9BACL|nr:DUF927 domain-containing protein [Jeotgalibacillus alimentarius]KIL45564.1 hypothetical protein KP77_28560 [Jeotgalibacillus alimentarius]